MISDIYKKRDFKGLSTAPRFRDVLRWRIKDGFDRRLEDEDEDVPFVEVDVESLKTENDYLLWVGHSTLLIKIRNVKILIDPLFADRILTKKRFKSLNYSLRDILPVDYVLVSHNHIDHLEADALRVLKNSCRYLVPAGLDYFMQRYNIKNYITFEWYSSFRENEMEFIFVPAQHWSQRGILDRNLSLWGGWIIKGHNFSIYYAGDTGYFNIFERLRKRYGVFDLSILPIGAYAPRWFSYKNHMSPYDALRAFCELNARKMLPVHWGAFRLGKESCSEPIRRLFSLWEKERVEEERLVFLPVGGVLPIASVTEAPISS